MIRLLFSDRFWLVKALVGLLLFSWMCHLSQADFRELMPPTGWIPAAYEKVKGKTIYPYPSLVQAVTPDGFEIVDANAGRLLVLTSDPPPVGAWVSIAGRVVAPLTLEAEELRIIEGWEWKRAANYLLSIATLAVFLFLIRKRFRWRPEAGVFRSRY